MSAWRLAVAPAAALLLSLGGVLLVAVRPVARPSPPRPLDRTTLPGFLRYVVQLVVGGYVALLLIVLLFAVAVVGDLRALPESAVWGAFLVGLAVPVFVTLSFLEGLLRSRWARGASRRTSAPGGGTGGAR